MRVTLAIALAVCLTWGTWAYVRFTGQLRPQRAAATEVVASGKVVIKLTTSHPAASDPFGPAVLVQSRGQTLVERTEPLAAGEPLVIDSVGALIAGTNELWIQVTPAPAEPLADESGFPAAPTGGLMAVRVEVSRGAEVLADETLWGGLGGLPVAGTVRIELDDSASEPNDESHHE